MRKFIYLILALITVSLIMSSQTDSVQPKYKVYNFRDGTKEIVQINPGYKDTTKVCTAELKSELIKLDHKIDSLIAKKKEKDDEMDY